MGAMTKKDIEAVLDRVRTWPIERQEDAARTLMRMEAGGTDAYILSDEERADIDEALEEVARGEVASDADVAALFNRLRR
jgi:DNA-binding NarL/FixJ family response regulator